MRKKIFSIILLFFVVLSNFSFSLISFFSYITNQNTCKISNILDIQEQCNMFVNLPKDFLDVCVKVSLDIKSFNVSTNKKQSLFPDNYSFYQIPVALICSVLKSKIVKNSSFNITNFVDFTNISLNKLFSVAIVFYLLFYIGLLFLFSSMNLLLLKNSICLKKSVYLS